MHRTAAALVYLLLAGCAQRPLPPVDYHESLDSLTPAKSNPPVSRPDKRKAP